MSGHLRLEIPKGSRSYVSHNLKRYAPLAVVAAGLAGAAPASAALPESIVVDSHAPSGSVSMLSTSQTSLGAGNAYVAQVEGTVSIWDPMEFTDDHWHVCGTPDASPAIPSPGTTSGPTGIDAEFRFAPVRLADKACPPTTERSSMLKLDAGAGFAHPAALPTSDAAAHVYRYAVRGTGAPVRSRFDDSAVYDNYGQFRITYEVPTAADCADGGAALLGFDSEAACVGGIPTSAASTSSPGTSAVAAASQSGPPAPQSGVLGATASSRICSSRRAFTIRIREPKARKLRSATVTVSGRKGKIKARRSKATGRLIAKIILKGSPKGRYTVKISAVTTKGKKISGKRVYKTCTPKITGTKAPRL